VHRAGLGSSGTVELKLADIDRRKIVPAGAVWAAELADGGRTWLVGYRGCSAFDVKQTVPAGAAASKSRSATPASPRAPTTRGS